MAPATASPAGKQISAISTAWLVDPAGDHVRGDMGSQQGVGNVGFMTLAQPARKCCKHDPPTHRQASGLSPVVRYSTDPGSDGPKVGIPGPPRDDRVLMQVRGNPAPPDAPD
jgi:hypothetical protein